MKIWGNILCVLLILNISEGQGMTSEQKIGESIKDISVEKMDNLFKKRIYFGHQSVGYNIIDGFKNLSTTFDQIKLPIFELNNEKNITNPGFYHEVIGKNTDPKSKIDAFVARMHNGVGNTVNIAFFKFCYVDITTNTDIQQVFKDYIYAMAELNKKFPNVKFVHCTVPLEKTVVSWKTRIKTFLGKNDIWEYGDNIKKNEFNDLLRNHYTGKEPLFDIAYYESVRQDGKRSTFKNNDKLYYDMFPEYTNDGGHLNEKGRRWVAENLLVFLSQL